MPSTARVAARSLAGPVRWRTVFLLKVSPSDRTKRQTMTGLVVTPSAASSGIVRSGTAPSDFAFVELHAQTGKMIAGQFLRNLIAALP